MLLRREGVYFSRVEHGSHKVLADSRGFQVFWPSGPVLYKSARQTIMAVFNGKQTLDGNCKDPCLTFDRYFRKKQESGPSIVEVLSSWNKLSVHSPEIIIRGGKELSIEDRELGIDLNVYHKDVRKLFYAGFSRSVVYMGYDPEEVLQEVYKGILVRNKGKCPHDPRKSSLGHYVHMVAGCIVKNYHRKHSRIRNHEQVENSEITDFHISNASIEASQLSYSMLTGTSEKVSQLVAQKCGVDLEVSERVLSMVSEGHTKSEVSLAIGMPIGKVSKLIKEVRSISNSYEKSRR